MVVLGLALFAAIAYNFGAWTMGSRKLLDTFLCTILPYFYNLNTRLEIVDTVLTLLIPSVTISVLNIRIIYAVFKIHRDQEEMNHSIHSFTGLMLHLNSDTCKWVNYSAHILRY